MDEYRICRTKLPSAMARLVVFVVLVLGFTQFCVKADSLSEDSDIRLAEEDNEDRSAYASAHALAGGAIRPGPRPAPGPVPVPVPRPGPGPVPKGLVECLACSGCPNAANATAKYCPYSPDPLKNGKCIVFSEKYYHMKNPWVVRGCVSERGSCADVQAALSRQSDLVTLESCRDCEGDRCNGAGNTLPDLMAALTALFITPLLMKYTLS